MSWKYKFIFCASDTGSINHMKTNPTNPLIINTRKNLCMYRTNIQGIIEYVDNMVDT